MADERNTIPMRDLRRHIVERVNRGMSSPGTCATIGTTVRRRRQIALHRAAAGAFRKDRGGRLERVPTGRFLCCATSMPRGL